MPTSNKHSVAELERILQSRYQRGFHIHLATMQTMGTEGTQEKKDEEEHSISGTKVVYCYCEKREKFVFGG